MTAKQATQAVYTALLGRLLDVAPLLVVLALLGALGAIGAGFVAGWGG